ncbi:TPA: ATP-binding cassette domain-containing protein, partial [Escherichia coli]
MCGEDLFRGDGCMSKYIINVSFQTRVNKTTRTLEIAESFGLGLD